MRRKHAVRPRRRPAGLGILIVGSGLSGVAGYVFQVVATRALGEEAYAPVGVLWTLQYLIFSVLLYPAETYVTRVRLAAEGAGSTSASAAVRAVLVFAAACAAVLALGAFLAGDAIFSGARELSGVVALIALAYGGYVAVRGLLAGAGDYIRYALATGAESVLRLLFVVLVVATVGATTNRVAYTLPAGAVLAPLLALAWRSRRPSGPAALPQSVGLVDVAASQRSGARRFLTATVLANAAGQTLLAGGPLAAVPLGATTAEISTCFVTVTLVRAPLVFGFGGLLARVMPPLTRRAQSGDWQAVRRVGVAMLPVSVATAALAGLLSSVLGPVLVSTFFGSGFRPARVFIGLTAAAAVLATANLLSNQMLVARGSEQRLVVPWLSALLAAVLVLLVPGLAPLTAVGLAFAAGELVAALALAVALFTAPPLSAAVRSFASVSLTQ
jgi:O-antigen/teichoic acid export membrane protein